MTKSTWHSGDLPPAAPITGAGWLRVGLRAVPLVILVFGGLLVHMALRLPENLLLGAKRPVTRHIAPFVSRNALRLMGVGYRVTGQPITQRGVLVANHSSWIDIFALNASQPLIFVSKAEVSKWPGIGWLARATGTVFIERDRRQAQAQTRVIRGRITAGDNLLFFPEGTSTDGRRILPFKSTLFEAFTDMQGLQIQPVTVVYQAPDGVDPRFYGWWGDMDFGAHLIQMLATSRHGQITVICHPPLTVADGDSRKSLALRCEQAVRCASEGLHPGAG